MSEEETVTSEQLPVISEEQETVEKLVPVSEAIRYRKRAQAAEKELLELKELHEKQAEELATIRAGNVSDRSGQAEVENMAKHSLTVAPVPSTPQAAGLMPQVSHKTQGVKETRTSGARGVLQAAARQAADSGSRNDVQEYLRIRRNYV